jgi:hypothetical protein
MLVSIAIALGSCRAIPQLTPVNLLPPDTAKPNTGEIPEGEVDPSLRWDKHMRQTTRKV